MKRIIAAVALPAVLLTGCYHASIVTGQPAGSEVISQPFATGWIYGLIPPATVETASKCRNGVARVETQYSFLNWLVGAVTFGIYTPMQIDVTCASSSKVSALPAAARTVAVRNDMSAAEMTTALEIAAELSRTTHEAVYLVR